MADSFICLLQPAKFMHRLLSLEDAGTNCRFRNSGTYAQFRKFRGPYTFAEARSIYKNSVTYLGDNSNRISKNRQAIAGQQMEIIKNMLLFLN